MMEIDQSLEEYFRQHTAQLLRSDDDTDNNTGVDEANENWSDVDDASVADDADAIQQKKRILRYGRNKLAAMRERFNDSKKRLYEAKQKQLDVELAQLQNGTLPRYKELTDQLDERWADRRTKLETELDCHCDFGRLLLAATKRNITNTFLAQRAALRHGMMQARKRQLWVLNDGHRSLGKVRQTVYRLTEPISSQSGPWEPEQPRAASDESYRLLEPISMRLSKADQESDLTAIAGIPSLLNHANPSEAGAAPVAPAEQNGADNAVEAVAEPATGPAAVSASGATAFTGYALEHHTSAPTGAAAVSSSTANISAGYETRYDPAESYAPPTYGSTMAASEAPPSATYQPAYSSNSYYEPHEAVSTSHVLPADNAAPAYAYQPVESAPADYRSSKLPSLSYSTSAAAAADSNQYAAYPQYQQQQQQQQHQQPASSSTHYSGYQQPRIRSPLKRDLAAVSNDYDAVDGSSKRQRVGWSATVAPPSHIPPHPSVAASTSTATEWAGDQRSRRPWEDTADTYQHNAPAGSSSQYASQTHGYAASSLPHYQVPPSTANGDYSHGYYQQYQQQTNGTSYSQSTPAGHYPDQQQQQQTADAYYRTSNGSHYAQQQQQQQQPSQHHHHHQQQQQQSMAVPPPLAQHQAGRYHSTSYSGLDTGIAMPPPTSPRQQHQQYAQYHQQQQQQPADMYYHRSSGHYSQPQQQVPTVAPAVQTSHHMVAPQAYESQYSQQQQQQHPQNGYYDQHASDMYYRPNGHYAPTAPGPDASYYQPPHLH